MLDFPKDQKNWCWALC